jgi:peptidoglycan hydrolase CwlO-like protein
MKRENRKSIEANLRNKLAVQYKEKTEQLKSEKAALEIKYNKLWCESCKIKRERDELKDKIQQYEDWIQRLQEFMDMNDDDRKAYVETLRAQDELKRAVEGTRMYGYLKHLFGLMI